MTTSAPSTNAATYRQPDTAWPSTMTVQQPHRPWPQLSRAPVRPELRLQQLGEIVVRPDVGGDGWRVS